LLGGGPRKASQWRAPGPGTFAIRDKPSFASSKPGALARPHPGGPSQSWWRWTRWDCDCRRHLSYACRRYCGRHLDVGPVV